MSTGGTALRLRVAADQRLGPRDSQNDRFGASSRHVVVADGMGSSDDAGVAAERVVESYTAFATALQPGQDVASGLLTMPGSVVSELATAGIGSGSTVAAGILDSYGRLWLASIGDSRVLLVRGGGLLYASPIDNEAAVARALGIASADPLAEHRLSRYLSADSLDYTPTIAVFEAIDGDVLIAVSDGADRAVPLFGLVALAAEMPGAGSLVAAILAEADRCKLTDNATCVVATILRGGGA